MSNQKIFLTANTYFGRVKALNLPKRKEKYQSVSTMNQSMIDSWNSKVNEKDIVYHFGYFAHDPQITNDVLELLNGNICFLNNKTDKAIVNIMSHFSNVILHENQIVELHEKNSVLCYYPLEIWDNSDSFHFYGDDRIKTDLKTQPKRMNISWDTWGKPILIDDCISFMDDFITDV